MARNWCSHALDSICDLTRGEMNQVSTAARENCDVEVREGFLPPGIFNDLRDSAQSR